MPEIQLGCHTIQSHGMKVARFHMHDWIILFMLAILEIILNVIEPFHRFVGRDMLVDLSYPMKGNTIPFWAIPIMGILVPLIVFSAFYFKRRDVYDLHHATLGILYAALITGVLTDSIKDGVGRPRPDFFWRCFPNGTAVFDPVNHGVLCFGDKAEIREGHKSFPSGHTSWAFAGMVFISWYLCGKIKVFDRKGHVGKLCLVLLPVLLAALVGVSRVDDYWHHWQDVFGGAIIGTVVASFCYLQFYPYPYDANGWAPYAYFDGLMERNVDNAQSETGTGNNSRSALYLEYGREAAV